MENPCRDLCIGSKTTWDQLSAGDWVMIAWLDYLAEGQPPVYRQGGPHRVISTMNHELSNGANCFRWDGDLYRCSISEGLEQLGGSHD